MRTRKALTAIGSGLAAVLSSVLSSVLLIITIIPSNGWSSAAMPDMCTAAPIARIGARDMRLWDLEVTGIDLLREEGLLQYLGPSVPVAIVDAGLELGVVPPKNRVGPISSNLPRIGDAFGTSVVHGNEVAALIFNPLVGLGSPAKLTAIMACPCEFLPGWTSIDEDFYPGHYAGEPYRIKCDFTSALGVIARTNARLINISGPIGSWKATRKQFADLSGPIVVTSAGNDPFDPRFPAHPVKSAIKAIVVGTIDLDGNRRGNFGDAIDLLGPIATPSLSSPDGMHPQGPDFGLSSGATALTSSTIVAGLALLPALNADSAERLLKMTATKTNADRGMLNAYRFIRVVGRIKAMLRKQNLAETAQTIENLLTDTNASGLFDFSSDASRAFRLARGLQGQSDCESSKQRERLLLKAFLLEPSPEHRRAIIDLKLERAATGDPRWRSLDSQLAKFISTLGET